MQPASVIASPRPEKAQSPWLGDLMGGITSAVVALPLALAFAIASGVDPKAGLYTAIVAGIVASLFGGSPLQITGPTGAMAVILAGIVAQYGLEKVWIAGLMAGAIQIGLGLGRLGRMITFLPIPVITGFTNGIGVLIFCGQLGNFLGLAPEGTSHALPGQLYWQATHLGQANLANVGLGLATIVLMVTWGKVNKTVPGSLVALGVVTAGSAWVGLEVPRIGAVPQGLPMPSVPPFDPRLLQDLIRPAVALAALGAIESLLSATVADRLSGSKPHDPDKELIGQGLANLAVPFFGGIPATGAIARTAVNIRSGARTRMSGVIHGVVIALALVALGPLAANIPLAALAGILMVTSFRMIEWDQVHFLLRSTRSDFAVMAVTWATTVVFDLVLAVEVGLAVASILFIRRMADLHLVSHPEVCVASGVPASEASEIGVYDIDRPLFFADAPRFVELLRQMPECRALLLRMGAVSTMDATAALSLSGLVGELQRRGIEVAMCDVAEEVRGLLERTQLISAGHFHPTADRAIAALRQRLASSGDRAA